MLLSFRVVTLAIVILTLSCIKQVIYIDVSTFIFNTALVSNTLSIKGSFLYRQGKKEAGFIKVRGCKNRELTQSFTTKKKERNRCRPFK